MIFDRGEYKQSLQNYSCLFKTPSSPHFRHKEIAARNFVVVGCEQIDFTQVFPNIGLE